MAGFPRSLHRASQTPGGVRPTRSLVLDRDGPIRSGTVLDRQVLALALAAVPLAQVDALEAVDVVVALHHHAT
eukprot:3352817-Pyramimonas_sp.AAC.1